MQSKITKCPTVCTCSLLSLCYIITFRLFGCHTLFPSMNHLMFLHRILCKCSLCHRHNLTPVSNVYKAVLMSLFLALDELNKLMEIHFKFPFHLTDKFTNYGFLNRLIMVSTKSSYTGGGPAEQQFPPCFSQMNLTRSLLKYVTQAMQMVITNTEDLLSSDISRKINYA